MSEEDRLDAYGGDELLVKLGKEGWVAD